ncbi:hypothetical protein G9A89_000418, partial [Geosiphon pyriformis]
QSGITVTFCLSLSGHLVEDSGFTAIYTSTTIYMTISLSKRVFYAYQATMEEGCQCYVAQGHRKPPHSPLLCCPFQGNGDKSCSMQRISNYYMTDCTEAAQTYFSGIHQLPPTWYTPQRSQIKHKDVGNSIQAQTLADIMPKVQGFYKFHLLHISTANHSSMMMDNEDNSNAVLLVLQCILNKINKEWDDELLPIIISSESVNNKDVKLKRQAI